MLVVLNNFAAALARGNVQVRYECNDAYLQTVNPFTGENCESIMITSFVTIGVFVDRCRS